MTAKLYIMPDFTYTLIHADYSEEGNIVIEQWIDRFRFRNPGTMLISRAQYYQGGDSVCRNKALQKMFMLIGYSEKAGSGVNKIMKGWEDANWQVPYLEEINQPDKIELNLPMVGLLPEDAIESLKNIFGERINSLEHDELITLVSCYTEKKTTNGQLQYLIDKHSTEITKMLKSLCQEGYLISEGKGKGTQYRVKEPEAKVGTSEAKVGTLDAKVGTSDAKVGTSETKVGTSPKNKDRLSFQELESLIMTITQEYATIEEIATQVNRNLEYLANKIIPKMLEHGTIIRLYPGTPNHPKQKYKANHQQ